ncbi:hypothetical protein [Achromobacter sp. UMC46]|uniref:hypothetical protein n=1 Tax=Achromobacter sp. UMC46 TaxID=1862319 RepID=UPI001602F60D|nr:hypothetical protein [Achromobacter sp. UMC46]MBB1594637.1 hypothetical protein [Achromobacter sp. UMC46]
MNLRAIEPIRAARIDDAPDGYRAERLRAQAQTQTPADRVARPQAPPFAHCLKNAIQAYHDQLAALDAHSLATHQALRDEQTAQQVRAEAANDLGTIQGLLPLQPYRFSVGLPLILPHRTSGR